MGDTYGYKKIENVERVIINQYLADVNLQSPKIFILKMACECFFFFPLSNYIRSMKAIMKIMDDCSSEFLNLLM